MNTKFSYVLIDINVYTISLVKTIITKKTLLLFRKANIIWGSNTKDKVH